MQKAPQAVLNGTPTRPAAKEFRVSESNIRRRKQLLQAGKELVGSEKQGHRTGISQLYQSTCATGFSPFRLKVQNIVKDYVDYHDLRTPFKNNTP